MFNGFSSVIVNGIALLTGGVSLSFLAMGLVWPAILSFIVFSLLEFINIKRD